MSIFDAPPPYRPSYDPAPLAPAPEVRPGTRVNMTATECAPPTTQPPVQYFMRDRAVDTLNSLIDARVQLAILRTRLYGRTQNADANAIPAAKPQEKPDLHTALILLQEEVSKLHDDLNDALFTV